MMISTAGQRVDPSISDSGSFRKRYKRNTNTLRAFVNDRNNRID